jgi:hypothetical protein
MRGDLDSHREGTFLLQFMEFGFLQSRLLHGLREPQQTNRSGARWSSGRWSIRPKFMLILPRCRANRLGGGIKREIILHQVGPLIDNGAREFNCENVDGNSRFGN